MTMMNLYSPIVEAAEKIGFDENGKLADATAGRTALELIRAHFWLVRDPATREVLAVKRTTVTSPRGGILFDVGTAEVRQMIMAAYSDIRQGEVVSANEVKNALDTAAGEAPTLTKEPYLRVGGGNGKPIWIDLGREDGQCVRVDASGWTIEDEPEVFFRRTAAIGKVPTPVAGGSLDALWAIAPVASEDRALVRAWLVQALTPGKTPCPVLYLHGMPGSAKSTASTAIGLSSLDSPARTSLQKDEKDMIVSIAGSWVSLIDNISHLDVSQTDVFCRIVTGDTYRARQLHTNGGVFQVTVRRPVIMNGVNGAAMRDDLAQRSIVASLEPIREGQRRTEKDVWTAFDAARPGILGAVLDDLVHVLAMPAPKMEKRPRMADYAETAAKLDAKYGSHSLVRYLELAKRVAVEAVTSDPVWLQLAYQITEQWRGSSSELLKRLDPDGSIAKNSRAFWPTSPQQLTSILKKGADTLIKAGWTVELDESATAAGKAGVWTIQPPPLTAADVASGLHPLGCRCPDCDFAPHVRGCHCEECSAA